MFRFTARVSGLGIAGALLGACGPRAYIPPLEPMVEHSAIVDSTHPANRIARSLAPVMFVHRDEWFTLERLVAIVHPTRKVIAYHLLWRDDAHGAWIPFTRATDQEIVWVGYDSTGAPTEMWTYWHGRILHTPWRGRVAEFDAQWGKHGSLPRGLVLADLPALASLGSFYAMTWIGAWDIALGKTSRAGPWCFCHGYGRYREFTKPVHLADRVDVVAQTDDPRTLLASLFGRYSKKHPWPWR